MTLTISQEHDGPKWVLTDWPQTDEELWLLVAALWGIQIPMIPVCDYQDDNTGKQIKHRAPFDVFADIYFGRVDNGLVKASRGLAGKTYLAAALANTLNVRYGGTGSQASLVLLGGSLEQSINAHNYTQGAWSYHNPDTGASAPEHLLASDPAQRETKLTNGAIMRVLAASTKSARGPHPPFLILDEIDEMKEQILDSALGQPMPQTNLAGETVDDRVLKLSTHHYPDKMMSRELKRHAAEGSPIYEWCFRESMVKDLPADDFRRRYGMETEGWLTEAAVERTKGRVTRAMWENEYELQEPSIEGRAFDTAKVEAMFDRYPDWVDWDHMQQIAGESRNEYGGVDGNEGVVYEFTKPDDDGAYHTGVDWAKDVDWSIFTVFDTRADPWRCVAWMRLGRRPWPEMVEALQTLIMRWPGDPSKTRTWHDATGVGHVVDDYVTLPHTVPESMWPVPINMVGERRRRLFADVVGAVEGDHLRMPRIEYAYSEFLYCTRADLSSGPMSKDHHPPDSVVAVSMAWAARDLSEVSVVGAG